MTQRILIIEDEADIRELIRFNLAREGFDTLEAADGLEGLRLAEKHRPDLILLDLMLPGLDGIGVCKELQKREQSAQIPIIMLTAKGEEVDRILGLELGATDYVVKPFSPRELVLRCKGVLKRAAAAPDPDSTIIKLGAVTMDLAAHSVFVDRQKVDLTLTEYKLLEDLIRHKARVRSREQLLDAVWGYSFEGYARTVDTHVRRLRAKLGPAADCIETVRGIGYRAREDEGHE